MPPDTPEALLQQGQDLLAAGKREEAQAALHNAGRLCQHGPSLLQIGHALHSAGDTFGALATYRRASSHDSTLVEAPERVAALLMDMGGAPAAESFLKTALEQHPQVAILHLRMAQALESNEKFEEAFSAAAKASELDSKSDKISMTLQRLREKTGRNQAKLVGIAPGEADLVVKEFEGTPTLKVPVIPAPNNTRSAIPKRADSSTNASAMTSDLSEFQLPELLGLLIARRATGRMEVYSDNKSAVIGLHKGAIVFAHHSTAQDMYTFLIESDAMPPVSLEALDISTKDSDARIATQINKYGLLENDDLVELIKDRIGQSLKTMMSWTAGYSSFMPSSEEALGDTFNIKIDTQWAVFEAFRQLDEEQQ